MKNELRHGCAIFQKKKKGKRKKKKKKKEKKKGGKKKKEKKKKKRKKKKGEKREKRRKEGDGTVKVDGRAALFLPDAAVKKKQRQVRDSNDVSKPRQTGTRQRTDRVLKKRPDGAGGCGTHEAASLAGGRSGGSPRWVALPKFPPSVT